MSDEVSITMKVNKRRLFRAVKAACMGLNVLADWFGARCCFISVGRGWVRNRITVRKMGRLKWSGPTENRKCIDRRTCR